MEKLFYTPKDLAKIYDRSEAFGYSKIRELQAKQKELEPEIDQISSRISKHFFHKITGIPMEDKKENKEDENS